MTTEPSGPSEPEPKLIPPRTAKERQAYVQGWMDAIVMIDKEGLEAARAWLAEMAALELDLMERRSGAQHQQ